MRSTGLSPGGKPAAVQNGRGCRQLLPPVESKSVQLKSCDSESCGWGGPGLPQAALPQARVQLGAERLGVAAWLVAAWGSDPTNLLKLARVGSEPAPPTALLREFRSGVENLKRTGVTICEREANVLGPVCELSLQVLVSLDAGCSRPSPDALSDGFLGSISTSQAAGREWRAVEGERLTSLLIVRWSSSVSPARASAVLAPILPRKERSRICVHLAMTACRSSDAGCAIAPQPTVISKSLLLALPLPHLGVDLIL